MARIKSTTKKERKRDFRYLDEKSDSQHHLTPGSHK